MHDCSRPFYICGIITDSCWLNQVGSVLEDPVMIIDDMSQMAQFVYDYYNQKINVMMKQQDFKVSIQVSGDFFKAF